MQDSRPQSSETLLAIYLSALSHGSRPQLGPCRVGKLFREPLVHLQLLSRHRLDLLQRLIKVSLSHLQTLSPLLRILRILCLGNMLPQGQHHARVRERRNICTSIPIRLPSQLIQVHVLRQRSLTGMNLEDLLPRLQVRRRNKQQPVKPTRSQQGRVNNVRSIRSRDDDDVSKLLETIHLGQELANHPLSHVRVATATSAGGCNRVNLVEKYYTRC